MKKSTHKTVSLPEPTYDLLCGVALHAGPDIGRRVALHEVVTAALVVARYHHDDLAALLRGEQPYGEPTEGEQR